MGQGRLLGALKIGLPHHIEKQAWQDDWGDEVDCGYLHG